MRVESRQTCRIQQNYTGRSTENEPRTLHDSATLDSRGVALDFGFLVQLVSYTAAFWLVTESSRAVRDGYVGDYRSISYNRFQCIVTCARHLSTCDVSRRNRLKERRNCQTASIFLVTGQGNE